MNYIPFLICHEVLVGSCDHGPHNVASSQVVVLTHHILTLLDFQA